MKQKQRYDATATSTIKSKDIKIIKIIPVQKFRNNYVVQFRNKNVIII